MGPKKEKIVTTIVASKKGKNSNTCGSHDCLAFSTYIMLSSGISIELSRMSRGRVYHSAVDERAIVQLHEITVTTSIINVSKL